MKYLIIIMLVLGCSTAKPKPKVKPTIDHMKRCMEIVEKHAVGKHTLKEKQDFCKCAINITTDENPDISTQIRIVKECL